MKKRAFTLVELLIVVVIIGILAAIVTLALSSYSNRAKDAATQSVIASIKKSILIMNADGNVPADCSTGSVLEIVKGPASLSDGQCTAGDIGLSSTADDTKDGFGDPIKLKYVSPSSYRITGKVAGDNTKCWLASSTTDVKSGSCL